MKHTPKLQVGFTTRNGGNSFPPYESFNMGYHVGDLEERVTLNRNRLAKELSFPLVTWIGTEQIHDAHIQKVTSEDAGKGSVDLHSAIKGIDGIYTAETNILLTSLYADCVPLYFYSEKAQLVGLAHAGWRGTVKQISVRMLNHWIETEKVAIEDIQIAIGPCISSQAYEVNTTVIEAIDACFEDGSKEHLYQKLAEDKYLLDLRAVNKQLLINNGIQESQVIESKLCTANDNRLYSHRFEGGKTGRMMSFIGLRD